MFRVFVLASTLIAAVPVQAMNLTSSDFTDGAAIPQAHIHPRCGGQNISPQLSWNGAPKETESYVITMIDLDVTPAKWSHWILVGIPASVLSLASGADTIPLPQAQPSSGAIAAPAATMPDNALGVVSNFGDTFYDGPCPPAGSGTHHYQLTVWALPAPTFSIDPDEKATDLMLELFRGSLDHASITGFVAAPAKAP